MARVPDPAAALPGAGTDTVRYTDAAQSRSMVYGSGYDTVAGFDGAVDTFDLWTTVPGDTAAAVTTGTLSKATFNADLEAAFGTRTAGSAVFFSADVGNLVAMTFLMVDTNGNGMYNGGADLLVKVDKTTSSNLGSTIFI
jgi:hypothetical protein